MKWYQRLLNGIVNVVCGVSIIASGYVLGSALQQFVDFIYRVV